MQGNRNCPFYIQRRSEAWGRILQQYADKVTLNLSKGGFFFTYILLGLVIDETKVRNVQE